MPFLQTLGNLWQHALAGVFPPTCVACGTPLAATAQGFCPACYGALPWWNKQLILPPRLPNVIQSFSAPLLYQESARTLTMGLKFHDRTHIAPTLARLMVPHVPPTAQLLIPVPMHAKRLRERTFNQAALLAQHLAKLTGIPTNVHALTRLIPSDGQVHRTRAQRLKLSSRHFQANPQIVAGKHIVLIDDILTTGSTARACALALKRAGARTITVVTLCLTPEG